MQRLSARLTHLLTIGDGYLVGLSERERSGLIGPQLDLKLPNGQTGRAVMTDYNAGALTGVREAPF